MNVGERIRYFRTLKGYTTNKLANLSGISQSYLRDVELGNKNPTIETLSYVCDALNISLQDFLMKIHKMLSRMTCLLKRYTSYQKNKEMHCWYF